MIFFERLTQEFYTLFEYTFQEGSEIKLLNINIIQSKYGISINQTDHIIKKYHSRILGNKKQDIKLSLRNHHSQKIPPLNK